MAPILGGQPGAGTLRLAAVVAATVALSACSGRSGLRRLQKLEASGSMNVDARADRFDEPLPSTDLRDTTSVGVGARGIAGTWLGAAFGVDVRLGAGLQGGVLYHTTLRPLGLGVHVGRFATLAITGGIGVDGVSEHLGFAVRWPLGARLSLDLGHHVHLDGWGELAWISAEDARESGSDGAPFGDELAGGAAVRVGRGATFRREARWGNGYFLGATYSEQLGTRRFGLVLGYGINAHYRSSR